MTNLHYHFIPSLRRGFAASIRGTTGAERAQTDIRLHLAAAELDGTTVQPAPVVRRTTLYGPRDVLGFDPNIVTRTDPLPDVNDFEPNYFPAIEFVEPDYPWRFTAAEATTDGQLLPWITLIVLIAEDQGEDVRKEFAEGSRANGKLPASIKVKTTDSLPDLGGAWRWAHVQVTRDDGLTDVSSNTGIDTAKVGQILVDTPEDMVSRLLSPRRLMPRTRYEAFVVPTFELGRAAGLGVPPKPGAHALTPAWTSNAPPAEIQIPYYYRWSFVTTERGDFESLVRLLTPRPLSGLGLRPMDAGQPGYNIPGVHRAGVPDEVAKTLMLEAALQSTDTTYTQWGKDSVPPDAAELFQVELAPKLLNLPTTDLELREFSANTNDAAPQIINVAVSLKPWGNAVRLTWRTNAPATSAVYYGLAAAYGKTIQNPGLRTDHEVTVSGLDRDRTYHFQIQTEDEHGIATATVDNTFFLPGLPNVVPPIYGRWHAARSEVSPDPAQNAWIDVLNLDPRHRAGAGLGALVVERQQESLMASAWDQLGDAAYVNDTLRRATFARETARYLYARFLRLTVEDLLLLSRPVHDRMLVKDDTGTDVTVHKRVADSPIPSAAFDPACRRISAPRRSFRRRQKNRGQGDLLKRLAEGTLRAAGPHPKPAGTYNICDITKTLVSDTFSSSGTPIIDPTTGLPVNVAFPFTPSIPSAGVQPAVAASDAQPASVELTFTGGGTVSTDGSSIELEIGTEASTPGSSTSNTIEISVDNVTRFCEKNLSCPVLNTAVQQDNPFGQAGIPSQTAVTTAICNVLDDWLSTSGGSVSLSSVQDGDAFLHALREAILERIDPEIAIAERIGRQIQVTDNGKTQGDFLAARLWSPQFPQPMYEPLRDLSQELILPGLENIPDNTVSLVETNGRFIESYMVGLNHSMAGELLWREFPTDQRGTYFRQFWDVSAFLDPEDDPEPLRDIEPLNMWGNNPLGDNDNRAVRGNGEQLVLLIRGQLLRRYPNTVIYAIASVPRECQSGPKVPALREHLECSEADKQSTLAGIEPIAPIFSGTLKPDVAFFGFPFDEVTARSDEYFIVIEERPGELRFGLDAPPPDPAPDPQTWFDLSWAHFQTAGGQQLAAGDYLDMPPVVPPQNDQGRVWDPDSSSATRAWITMQRPVRIAIPIARMLLAP